MISSDPVRDHDHDSGGEHPLEDVPQHDLMGIKVSTPTMSQLMATLDESLELRRPTTVTFINPNYALAARRDESLRRLIDEFDIDLVDGWGISLAARVFGFRVPERLANDDIGAPLFALLSARKARVFLFGSAPGIPEAAAKVLQRYYPGIEIVGTMTGWVDVLAGHPRRFEAEDLEPVVDQINASNADFVMVGLPTPHQQRFVTEYRDRITAPVIMTGGSYLDHLTERIEWYPGWVKRLRICWLYRLVQDPKRLWYRYSIELLDFGREVLRASRERSRGQQRTT
jgi:N-acetylglucosaminyldiphosphoundecaprenol N-acetyl-beta-D-mannosaminyltransferase